MGPPAKWLSGESSTAGSNPALPAFFNLMLLEISSIFFINYKELLVYSFSPGLENKLPLNCVEK